MCATLCRMLVVASALIAGDLAWAKKPDKSEENTADLTLVIGDSYTVRAARAGASQKLEGELVKITDRWIVLRHTSPGRRERIVPMLSKVPFVGPLFRTRGVSALDEFVWIPRDAVTVEARRQSTKPPTDATTLGDQPAVQVLCAVDVAVGERVTRREGGLESLSSERLMIAVPGKVDVTEPLPAFGLPVLSGESGKKRTETRYSREQFALHDILCIHVPNYDPATLVSQAR
jgi:hypothetical protein